MACVGHGLYIGHAKSNGDNSDLVHIHFYDMLVLEALCFAMHDLWIVYLLELCELPAWTHIRVLGLSHFLVGQQERVCLFICCIRSPLHWRHTLVSRHVLHAQLREWHFRPIKSPHWPLSDFASANGRLGIYMVFAFRGPLWKKTLPEPYLFSLWEAGGGVFGFGVFTEFDSCEPYWRPQRHHRF